jgi:ubiquinone/menaquinone biosynthesis C-methylase UbiE
MDVIKLIFQVILFTFPVSIFCQNDRESRQPRNKIIESIGVREAFRIGEIGVGSGYLTFHLAKKVGAKGMVFANEINPVYLKKMDSIIVKDKIENIITVLGSIQDPMFPEGNLDMIVMLLVLHHLDEPEIFMGNVKKYLKDKGELVVIERNDKQSGTEAALFLSESQILEILTKAGFKLERKESFLPMDTIYILTVKS